MLGSNIQKTEILNDPNYDPTAKLKNIDRDMLHAMLLFLIANKQMIITR